MDARTPGQSMDMRKHVPPEGTRFRASLLELGALTPVGAG